MIAHTTPIKAVIFGSIGTLVETSELQREAFNQAFKDHGLGWKWDEETYRRLLDIPGGAKRLRAFNDESGDDVPGETLDAIHTTKNERFQKQLRTGKLKLRSEVGKLVNSARAEGVLLGLATTTEPATVSAILSRFSDIWGSSPFHAVLDGSRVEREKPDPEVYTACLKALAITARDALAIEDSPSSTESARSAGVPVVATPSHYFREADFGDAPVLERLSDAPALQPLFEP